MAKLAFAVLSVAAMFVISCSPRGGVVPLEETGASLEGTITYGSQPVPCALVIVVPASGPQGTGGATAFADDEGRFKVDNVAVGQVKVAVNTEAARGQMIGRGMAGTDPNAKAGKRAAPPKIVDVPKSYQNPDTSGITTTVKRGSNPFNIVIPK
jgi:hypothetical protein